MATHKRSTQKVNSRHTIFNGVTNYGSDTILGNSRADNQTQLTASRSESRKAYGWVVGKTNPKLKHQFSSRKFEDMSILSFHDGEGSVIGSEEIEETHGRTRSNQINYQSFLSFDKWLKRTHYQE